MVHNCPSLNDGLWPYTANSANRAVTYSAQHNSIAPKVTWSKDKSRTVQRLSAI